MTVSTHGPDTTSGPTTAEAARLLAAHGPNEVGADIGCRCGPGRPPKCAIP
ncbi:hypothetical protein [Kitasatospora sp. NPDC058190]|uniref:hypothetical protein n=1 Tax=Kitasatospora sp. NPDC058190 TaxID=3346371 RepID=UPI0036DBD2DF